MSNAAILVCFPWHLRNPEMDCVCVPCEGCFRELTVSRKNNERAERDCIKLVCFACAAVLAANDSDGAVFKGTMRGGILPGEA